MKISTSIFFPESIGKTVIVYFSVSVILYSIKSWLFDLNYQEIYKKMFNPCWKNLITLVVKLDRIYQFMKKIGYRIEKVDVNSKFPKIKTEIPLTKN